MQGQGQDQDQDQQLDQRFVDKQIMKCFNILQHVTTKMLPIESSFRRYKVHRHILEEVTPSEGVKWDRSMSYCRVRLPVEAIFDQLSRRSSETVRDTAKVTINH